MDTKTVNILLLDDPNRRQKILDILERGKVVRFHYPRPSGESFYKDVNVFEPDAEGDLRCFRQSGGVSDYVCWDAPWLRIEEVEP